MKLIKPSEISARILTLLDESDERVILVSPYMKISKWYKFTSKVKSLKSRNIHTDIYVRDDPENTATYRDLDLLALDYKKIPHLHSKLYLNEKYGIVTSMNLLLSSEINSLEIGYATETWMEYNELLAYYHRYIQIGDEDDCDSIAGQSAADLNEIIQRIREGLNGFEKNSWLWLADNALHISTGSNNYIVSIIDSFLRISACLKITSRIKQGSTLETSLIEEKASDLTSMKVHIHPAIMPDNLQLSGQARHSLKSTAIMGILEADSAYIINSVIRYIVATENLGFKNDLQPPEPFIN